MILRIKWAEAHHLYAGIALFALGIVGVAAWGWWEYAGFACSMGGLLLAWDDIYQHWRQMFQPEYRSWVNRFYRWAWDNTLGRIIKWPEGL